MQGISPIERMGSMLKQASSIADSSAGADGFAGALKSALDEVTRLQNDAGTLATELQLGNASVSLEETVIAQAKANIAFQAAVQTRNRLVSAYHDIMNMPV